MPGYVYISVGYAWILPGYCLDMAGRCLDMRRPLKHGRGLKVGAREGRCLDMAGRCLDMAGRCLDMAGTTSGTVLLKQAQALRSCRRRCCADPQWGRGSGFAEPALSFSATWKA